MIFGLEIFEFLIALAAVLGACGVVWKMLVRPIVRAVRLIHRTYDQVMDYDDRLAGVEERSEELVNNSGSSLRDAVDRIESVQGEQSQMFAAHLDWAQDEILRVWQALASRDTVKAAEKTAEMIDLSARKANGKG